MNRISKILMVPVAAAMVLGSCKTSHKDAPTTTSSDGTPGRGINTSYMDTSVRPNDDFFRYVNGKWLDQTEIPSDKTTWGSFNELRERTDSTALALLKAAAVSNNIDPKSDQAKAVYLYQTIMDTVRRNNEGVRPLDPFINQIKSINNIEDLQTYLATMEQYGGGGFFAFGVSADAKDSNKNITYLYPSSLGLPDRDFYLDDDKDSEEKRAIYVKHIAKMLEFAGEDAENARRNAKNILAFETRLAKPMLDKVSRRDARKTYNPMSIAELKKLFPAMEWEEFTKSFGASTINTIVVTQPEYFKELHKVLSSTTIEDWRNYLKWTLINDSASYLTTEMEKANWEFYSKTLRGAKEQLPREERALSQVNNSIGEALGKLYVEENFPPEAKQKAQEMISNVIKAYEVRIKDLPWMSPETKEKAIEKLSTTTVKVGYPDKWEDYSRLSIRKPENNGSYFQNMLGIAKWRFSKDIQKLNKPVDKSEWYMAPQIVNAYYNPSYNEIVFPAAILQPPFYDYKADAAVNYGGIGAVIGHEISHGFDDSGARFDAQGNLNNWWTDEDLKQFEKLGEELANQYNAIEVLPGLKINGAFTLGENIGDLGGVNAAYDGLKIYWKEHGKPGKIDGFTPEQRFFMSWATVWRTKMRDEAMANLIKTDPHSPGMYRAYVPLQNIEAFYEAFGIKAGDKMYVAPEDRVVIW